MTDRSQAKHPIGVVSKKTALRPDLIRVWEARYRAVQPARTESRHRLYSDADVERLLRRRQLVQAGQRIGHVAAMTGCGRGNSIPDGEVQARQGRRRHWDWVRLTGRAA